MCGIAGTLICGTPSIRQLDDIRIIFTNNLLANEERGKEATGVATINQSGDYTVFKQPCPARVFVKTRSYRRFLTDAVTPETTIILGHTRLPTKGDP